MARALLERYLSDPQLDSWFETVTQKQYTKQLLFAGIYGLMTQVVFRHQPSINAAYQNATTPLAATKPAVYGKLNNLEADTSAALVGLSATKSVALIH